MNPLSNGRRLLVTVVLALALAASATQIRAASPIAPLSADHTAFGVSQLIVHGSVSAFRSFPLKLINPGSRAHIAAFLVYERQRISGGTPNANTPGLFLDCLVRPLGPNTALTIDRDSLPDTADVTDHRYAEIISVPNSPVTVGGQQTRLADGLGLAADKGGFGSSRPYLVHPAMFTLPLDRVSPGQRAAANTCICDQLAAQGRPADLFSEFGINCS